MSLYNMTEDEYLQNLDSFLAKSEKNPSIIDDYFSMPGHTDMMHTGLTEQELKHRAVDEHVSASQVLEYFPSDGEFTSKHDIIRQCLEANREKIAHFATTHGENKLELDTLFDNPVGYGYQKKTLEKMDTNVMRVVVKRDTHDPFFGIKIQTAFPDIDHRGANYIRQYECTRAGIDPYRDGKLTVEPEQLDDCRQIVKSKDEAVKEISEEITAVLKADRDKQYKKAIDMVRQFAKEEHIPASEIKFEKQIDEKTGRKSLALKLRDKTIGYLKKDHIAPKPRSLDEAKKEIKQEKELSKAAVYNGLFFDDKEKEKILNKAKKLGRPLSRPIRTPHVTLQYRPTPEQEKAFHRLLGKKVTVIVSEYGNDGRNEGFRVQDIKCDDPAVQKILDKVPSGIPYITVSVDKDRGRPDDTYRLFEGSKDASRRMIPMAFTAIVGEYVRTKDRGEYVALSEKDLPDNFREKTKIRDTDTPDRSSRQKAEEFLDKHKTVSGDIGRLSGDHSRSAFKGEKSRDTKEHDEL